MTDSISPDPKLIEVAVDVPGQGTSTYTYSLPADMVELPELGTLLLVPFGGRDALGYVVGLPADSDIAKVKNIRAVVDDFGIPSEYIEVCRWMAEYYVCSFGDALRLLLPPGGNRSVRCVITLKGGAKSLVDDESAGVLSQDVERLRGDPIIGTVFQAGGFIEQRKLERLLPGMSKSEFKRVLFSLEDAGHIDRSYQMSTPRIKEKETRAVSVVPGHTSVIASAGSLGPAQGRAYNLLLQSDGGPVALADLMSAADVSRAPISSLAEKGILTVTDLPLSQIISISEDAPAVAGEAKGSENGPLGSLPVPVRSDIDLTEEQASALKQITGDEDSVFVLDGVTGSGKTEVYLRSMAAMAKKGKGSILLVPEIALTPQTKRRVEARFGKDVAVLHSNLGERGRYEEWNRIAKGEVSIVVGTRSALFSPIRNLGLIVIDEEHEGSYKQGMAPRYHAREVALELAKLRGAKVVMGTATPSLEAEAMVGNGSATRIKLTYRPTGHGMAEVRVVDMKLESGASVLGETLQAEMKRTLEAREKVILLLNRRGFSSYLMCSDCGHVPLCRYCAVSMTYHRRESRLRCHHCNYSEKAPALCPECSSHELVFKGTGTQRAEDHIVALFPDVPLIRMDADSTQRQGSHARYLSEFGDERGPAILLGTQMIAKGLHFPEVTLVGVLSADSGIFIPDFRAAERTYQLIKQVAGRAGRGDMPGRVIVQTFNPDHYAIQAAAADLGDSFIKAESDIRRDAGYPPYRGLVSVVISHPDRSKAEAAAWRVTDELRGSVSFDDLELLGPASAPIERIKGRYRWHFLVKHPALGGRAVIEMKRHLGRIARAQSGDKNLNVIVDVDPMWVL